MGLRYILGDKAINRILDFFLVHKHWDYSLSDISEATKASYRTLQRIIPRLLEEGILKKTRVEGKAQLYMLNIKSEVVKRLDALALAIDLEELESKDAKVKLIKERKQEPEREFILARA